MDNAKIIADLEAEVARLRDGNTFLSRELGRAQADADRERCERVRLEETDNQQLIDAHERIVELETECGSLQHKLDAEVSSGWKDRALFERGQVVRLRERIVELEGDQRV